MSRYLNSPREADWYACPACGDEVRVGSSGCRKCYALPGETMETGPDEVSLPDSAEEFDYEDWKKREFGKPSKVKPHHLPWKYWFAGICVLGAMVWLLVFAGFLRH